MFNVGVLVFENMMLAAIRNAGVDNLEYFPAILFDSNTGKKYENYSVINIVGLIACADLENSNYVAHGSPMIDFDF